MEIELQKDEGPVCWLYKIFSRFELQTITVLNIHQNDITVYVYTYKYNYILYMVYIYIFIYKFAKFNISMN